LCNFDFVGERGGGSREWHCNGLRAGGKKKTGENRKRRERKLRRGSTQLKLLTKKKKRKTGKGGVVEQKTTGLFQTNEISKCKVLEGELKGGVGHRTARDGICGKVKVDLGKSKKRKVEKKYREVEGLGIRGSLRFLAPNRTCVAKKEEYRNKRSKEEGERGDPKKAERKEKD